MKPLIDWSSVDWMVVGVYAFIGLMLLNDMLPRFWFRRLLRALFPAPPPKRKRRAKRKTSPKRRRR